MNFPLTASDISLWLAVNAIIMLITSELLLSTQYSQNIIIDKKRLRLVALGLGTGFMITVIMRVFQPM